MHTHNQIGGLHMTTNLTFPFTDRRLFTLIKTSVSYASLQVDLEIQSLKSVPTAKAPTRRDSLQ